MTSAHAKSLILLAVLNTYFAQQAQGKARVKAIRQRVMIFLPDKDANRPAMVYPKDSATSAMSNTTIFAAADARIRAEASSDSLLVPKLLTPVVPSSPSEVIKEHMALPHEESEGNLPVPSSTIGPLR